MKLKILFFGEAGECTSLYDALGGIEALAGRVQEYKQVDDLEQFDSLLVEWGPSLLIVLADGASGMESVYRARQRLPDLPIFWFSDDTGFSMQSYRLECAYFSTKPATSEKIDRALRRCEHIGIPYATA